MRSLILVALAFNSVFLFGQSDSYILDCAHDNGFLIVDGNEHYFTDSLSERRTPTFVADNCVTYLEIDGETCYLEPKEDFAVQINDKWGCMDMFGNITLPVIYDELIKSNFEERTFVRKKKQWFEIKFGSNGKYKEQKIDCDFVSKTYLNCFIFVRGNEGYFSEKRGVATKDFKGEFDESYFTIRRGCKYGLMTITGRILEPAIYDDVFIRDNLISLVKDGKFGLYHPTKGLVTKIKYDYIGDYTQNGVVDYKVEGKEGLLSLEGGEITPPIYQSIYMGSDSLLKAKRMDKWGFLNLKGEEEIECTYEDITSFKNGLAGVKMNGKWGFINAKNELVIDYQYDNVDMGYYFRDPLKAKAKLGDECFYINRKGERLEDCPCR